MNRFDYLGIKLGEFIVGNRLLTIIAALAVLLSTAYGAQFLGFDTNYRVFFSEDNPQLQAFDELQKVYTKTDNIMFVVKPKDNKLFSRDTLSAIKELTTESWKLPYSTRVDSITNYQHTYAQGDDLTVIDLVEKDPQNLTDSELKYIKQVSTNEPLLVGRIISDDGITAGVNSTFYFPEKSSFEVPETAQAARELLAKIQSKYPNVEIRASGMVFMNNAFSESSQNDLKTLIPIMYGILILTMVIFLRCLSATLATVIVIAFSAMTAMGIAGFMGIKLTPPSASAPTIILTLAIADSIHIIISMFKEMQLHARSKNEAIIESLRINLQPVFLTSLTTAIGFLSLNFSDAPPFHDLGNITAIGVCAAFIYSIFLLPALLSLMPVNCRQQKVKDTNKKLLMNRFAEFVIRKRNPLLILSLIAVIGFGAMIPRTVINDQFVQYFDESISFRPDTEFMMKHLAGIYLVEYSIGADGSQGINDPKYLEQLEKFALWLKKQPEVDHAYSITDIYKRLNKNMHGDDESWYRLPDNREMAAQYLLLYEFSLPFGLDLNDRINVDKSATRVTATLKDMSTNEIKDFKARSENWLKDNTPKYMHTEATSPVIMFSYISERNINSMIKGNIIALLLISFTILIALRSFKMGLISLVPNLTPPLLGFGIWAIAVGQVNMAAAMVSAVSLGIIVDDTVHFLSKYYRARTEKGLNAQDSVRYAFSTVGSALVVTTFILIAGFSVLLFSGFELNSTLGFITALIIGVALILDFLLLPPLLMLLDKKNKGEKNEN